jgi:predicted metal-dependent phosphoesterase TrpH
LIKVDLHIHTFHSPDANTTFEELTSKCRQVGLDAIAIADHGTIEGALEFLETRPPFQVIVAEEILTHHGEIMGMFLKQTIPSGNSVEWTIKAIREQDGLICVPHPFDPVRSSALESRTLKNLAETQQIDVLEVMNARYMFKSSSRQAVKFAERYGLPKTAGSDAHSQGEIGSVYLKMPNFTNKAEFLEGLKKASHFGHNRSPLIHIGSMARKLTRKVKKP